MEPFLEYVSPIKSPYEENEKTQEDLCQEGYDKYFRDLIINSIGTSKAETNFNLSFNDALNALTGPEQEKEFIYNILDKIIKHYRMTYFTSVLNERNYSTEELISFIKFIILKGWLRYFPRCLSFIPENVIDNPAMLKIFINSDYENFLRNIEKYKTFNPMLKQYFLFSKRTECVDTIILILKDDINGNYVEQFKIQNGVK